MAQVMRVIEPVEIVLRAEGLRSRMLATSRIRSSCTSDDRGVARHPLPAVIPVNYGVAGASDGPYRASLPMLCTMHYSFHCTSTFIRPRSVKRSRPSAARVLANTGSTAPIRRL